MLFDQLIRCIAGLLEGLLWLFLVFVLLVGVALITGGFTATGLVIALAVVWFVASAVKNKA